MNLTVTKPQRLETNPDFPYKSFSDLPIYDQRYFPRWNTSRKAFYRKVDNSLLVRTETKDLTLAGVKLYINEDVHVKDYLDMKITLSSKDSFQAKGMVLWTKITPTYCWAGVLFDPLPATVQGLILEYGFVSNVFLDKDDSIYTWGSE